jgi:hypothetical protein
MIQASHGRSTVAACPKACCTSHDLVPSDEVFAALVDAGRRCLATAQMTMFGAPARRCVARSITLVSVSSD